MKILRSWGSVYSHVPACLRLRNRNVHIGLMIGGCDRIMILQTDQSCAKMAPDVASTTDLAHEGVGLVSTLN
jgi:hypothetical protein